jgi:hypothetical protein
MASFHPLALLPATIPPKTTQRHNIQQNNQNKNECENENSRDEKKIVLVSEYEERLLFKEYRRGYLRRLDYEDLESSSKQQNQDQHQHLQHHLRLRRSTPQPSPSQCQNSPVSSPRCRVVVLPAAATSRRRREGVETMGWRI